MSFVHSSRISGVSAVFGPNSNSWGVNCHGLGIEVRPKEHMGGWIHFAIPSPAVIHRTRLRANTATIRFATGPSACIKSIHVWDGDKFIIGHDGLNLRGNMQNHEAEIKNTPEVFYGTRIVIFVSFENRSSDAWVQLASAGVDFS